MAYSPETERAFPDVIHRHNDRTLNELWRYLTENVLQAERGDYRGGGEIRYNFTEQGRLRGVHFNNRLVSVEE